MRAVIADDSQVQLDVAKGLFRNFGITVVAACLDGTKAWKAIQEHKPDLVVLDYIMPDMTGADVAKKIRDSGMKTKIMFATSMSQKAAVFSAEYDAVLVKPYTAAFVALALAQVYPDGIH